jgi:protein gp37
VRRKVFCASLADVFDNQVDPQWRNDLWILVASTPFLDWLLLSKRPQNMPSMLPAGMLHFGGPWPNVWLGTTVENQEEADRRIPQLLAVPAAKRFLSCEPLLGWLNLRQIALGNGVMLDALTGFHSWTIPIESIGDARKMLGAMPILPIPKPAVDWVIVGGESGPGARPMHLNHARSLREQCAMIDVPFFFKQWGEFGPDIRRVGKKAAGALLDGVEHRAFPE